MWFMDGNFSLAPRVFQQLYVIGVPLATTYVTCVYALLSGKTQEEYAGMLRAVVNACSSLGYDPDPEFVMTDFEESVVGATKAEMGDHTVNRGCFYYLTQATWRKIRGPIHERRSHVRYDSGRTTWIAATIRPIHRASRKR